MSTKGKGKGVKRKPVSDTASVQREERKYKGEVKVGYKRIKITDPLEARVEMLDGSFELTPNEVEPDPKFPDDRKKDKIVKSGTLHKMTRIRGVLSDAGRKIQAILQEPGAGVNLGYDTGRAIAGTDTMQIAKNIFCDALILPHAHKDVKDGEEVAAKRKLELTPEELANAE